MDSDRQWPTSSSGYRENHYYMEIGKMYSTNALFFDNSYYKILFGKNCRYEQQQDQFIRCRNVQVMYIYQTHTA